MTLQARDLDAVDSTREPRPRLSVVATSRNDDHGGHLVERMQWFVDGLAWSAEQRAAPTELILVEWNPPKDVPPLVEVLSWPPAGSPLSVRILTVAPSEHDRLLPAGGIPMLQMIAKNVGIRRAKGENVLSTNIDILLAPDLFALSNTKIGKGTVWSADRYDVEFPFDEDVKDVKSALAWCASHPIRFERRDGIHYPGAGRVLPIYQGVGDLVAWQAKQLPGRASTLARSLGHRTDRGLADPEDADEVAHASAGAGVSPTRHMPADARSLKGLVDFARERGQAAVDLARLPKLHVNACGDFTLLAREDWLRFAGYPELVVHSMNIDTLFMHQMHANGMRFVDVEPPAVAYHMEHATGSGWTPEGQEKYFAGVAAKGMHRISGPELRAMKRSMLADARAHKPVLFNGPDWGLAAADVIEVRPTGR